MNFTVILSVNLKDFGQVKFSQHSITDGRNQKLIFILCVEIDLRCFALWTSIVYLVLKLISTARFVVGLFKILFWM